MDTERKLTPDERRVAKVWNYLRTSHAPTSIKATFTKLADKVIFDVDTHNLKFWQPQMSDEDWEER